MALSLMAYRLRQRHPRQAPVGMHVTITHICSQSELENFGDDRSVFVLLLPEDRQYINDDRVSKQEVPPKILTIMSRRSEPMLYFGADRTLTYETVVQELSLIAQESPETAVAVMTQSEFGSFDPEVRARIARSDDWKFPCLPQNRDTIVPILAR